jgi:hypothetical protein
MPVPDRCDTDPARTEPEVTPRPRPRPAFGVQCPVRASVSTRACPRVRCPVRASERPGGGVRCGRAVSVRSRVRCPTGVRSWSAAVDQAAAGWDGWGRRGRPPYPRSTRRLPKSEHGARGWHRPCWASGDVGPDLAVVVGVVGEWPVDRGPTRIGRMRARIARRREDCPSVGTGMRSEVRPPVPGCAARQTSTIAAQSRPRTVHVHQTSNSASDPATKVKGDGTTFSPYRRRRRLPSVVTACA